MATFTIGELSRRTGVPVKTIRYYHEEGILEPHATSDSGYRLYSEPDQERLAAIRSFRGLGFSIDAVRTLLDNPQDARTAAQLQLHVLQSQMRALRRQEAIVQSALGLEDESDIRNRLQLAYAAASLAAEERQTQMDAFLDRASGNEPSNAAKIRKMALLDLPDELEPRQLEAWLELSGLLHDEEFLKVLHEQHAPFEDAASKERMGQFGAEIYAISKEAQNLHDRGARSGDENAQSLADRWASLFADTLGRERDDDFLRWFLEYAEKTNDVRIERFWQLVAILRDTCAPSFHPGLRLLAAALRERLSNDELLG